MDTPLPLELLKFRQQLKKYADFTDEEWDLFATHLYTRKLAKKEHFTPSGKVCKEVGFILGGSFRFYYTKDGIELSSYFCFENDLISSYRSFLKQAPSEIAVDAMENSSLICFSHTSLQTLLADGRTAYRMEQLGRTIAEYLICCYEERLFSFVFSSPEERYRSLIEQQPDLAQKVPQHYLANYLGITPVSLSRIRKRIYSTAAKQKMAS
ncbi:MAG TPA: Crp/Fnr family transcriptional regulator [Flavisolibacter sp.]|nr:Crp/Fnr family transcriptional regulator [Flavisolibacter sp.]